MSKIALDSNIIVIAWKMSIKSLLQGLYLMKILLFHHK